MKKAFAVLGCAALVSACASRADNIQASYASSAVYQSMTCQQIGLEAARVSGRVAELTVTQNNKAVGDAVMTGVALVVFWPAALFVSGDGATAAELARVKGEVQALEQASIAKKCNIEFRKAA